MRREHNLSHAFFPITHPSSTWEYDTALLEKAKLESQKQDSPAVVRDTPAVEARSEDSDVLGTAKSVLTLLELCANIANA